MAKTSVKDKDVKEEYDIALSLMQYHIQLLWQQFGTFLLAETVLIGLLGTALAQENTRHIQDMIVIGGAIFGVLLCFPWWSTYWHNYKYYELRIAQARRHETKLGISLLTEGRELGLGNTVTIEGMKIRHPFLARRLPPRFAFPLLIFMFGLAFLALMAFAVLL
jgi:hypothetical protein